MDIPKLKEVLSELQKDKRKFSQSFDIIFVLKDLNLKKPEEQVDFYHHLPKGIGKEKKICGLVGPDLEEESQKNLDKTILQKDFETLTKKDVKKLSEEYDYFIAQATIMPKVAATFGRVFGPRNKMPNPKAGCVVPPKANLKPIIDRLKDTIRLKAKSALMIQASVGNESLSEEDLIENIESVYNAVVHHLPKEKNNMNGVYLKKTMSKSIRVE